jgi:hypothetical protein
MAAPIFATVLFLKHTGHVLGIVEAGAAEPTVDQLTGAGGAPDEPGQLRVRIPGQLGFVNVPADQLDVKRLAVPSDALDQPQSYRLDEGSLQSITDPAYSGAIANGTEGAKVVVVWQTDEESVVETGVLPAGGAPPSNEPTDALSKLVAYVGGGLYVVPA